MKNILLQFSCVLALASDVSSQTLDELFDQNVSATEITNVWVQWSQRTRFVDPMSLTMSSFSLQAETSGTQGGNDRPQRDWDVLSYELNGSLRHGAIKRPTASVAGESYPVLVFCPGGEGAINLEQGVGWKVLDVFLDQVGTEIEDTFFIVVPAYRGSTITDVVGGAQTAWTSDGDPSPLDYDVDDTMALLDVVQFLYTSEHGTLDMDKVVGYGASRGGGTVMLLGIRDARIDRLVDLFGPANLMHPYLKRDAEGYPLDCGGCSSGSCLDEPTLDRVFCVTGIFSVVCRFQFCLLGSPPFLCNVGCPVTLASLRQELIRGSAVRFPLDLPPLQVHHAKLDSRVSIKHSRNLRDVVGQAYAPATSPLEYFEYDGSTHLLRPLADPVTDVRAAQRIAPFLLEVCP